MQRNPSIFSAAPTMEKINAAFLRLSCCISNVQNCVQRKSKEFLYFACPCQKKYTLPRTTLPETNIAPENGWLEYSLPFRMAYFQVPTVSFRECETPFLFRMWHTLWCNTLRSLIFTFLYCRQFLVPWRRCHRDVDSESCGCWNCVKNMLMRFVIFLTRIKT